MQELINQLADRPALQSDVDFVKGLLLDLTTTMEKASSVKVKFEGAGSLRDLSGAQKDFNIVAQETGRLMEQVSEKQAKLNGHTKEYYYSLQKAADSELKMAKARKENAAASAQEEKAAQSRVKLSAQEQKQVEQLSNDYLQLSKAYNDAAMKAKNYAVVLGLNHPSTVAAVADAKSMYDVLLKVDQAVGQNQRNVGNYKSAFDGLGFSFTQIARELPSLTISLQQFALAISNNLPIAIDEIGKAKVQIAALKAEGKTAPSLFSQIGKSILSFQVLMSVGIALFVAFSKQIGDFFSRLISGKEKINALRESQSALNEVLSKGNGEYGHAVKELEEMATVFKLARDGVVDKKEALEKYNDGIGKVIGQAKDLNEAEKKTIDGTAAYLQVMLLRAAANLALEKATEAAVEAELNRQKKDKEFQSIGTNASVGTVGQSTAPGFVPGLSDFTKGAAAREKAAKKEKAEVQKGLDERVKTFKDVRQSFIDQMTALAKQSGFDINELFGLGDKDKNNKTESFLNELLRAEEDAAKSLAAIRKRKLEEDIKDQEKIITAEEFSQQERLKAVKAFVQDKIAIVNIDSTLEIKSIVNKLDEIQKIEAKSVADRTTEEKKLLISKKALLAEKLNLEDAAQTEINNILEDGAQKSFVILQKFKAKQRELLKADVDLAKDLPKESPVEVLMAREDKVFEKRKSRIQEDRDILIRSIEEQRNAKIEGAKGDEERQKIEDKFNRKRVAAELEADRLILLAALEVAKAKLKLVQDPVLKAALEAQIADLKKQLEQLKGKKLDFDIDPAKKKLEELKEAIQEIGGKVLQAFTAIGDIIGASIDRQKNAIQELIDKNEEKKAKEIEAVNQSALSEQDKAAKIAVINARAANEKERLERRQRALDLERAKFDKAKNIAEAIMRTAVAVIEGLIKGGPPLAAIYGAIGAIEIAAAIAAPLPKFQHGTDSAPGGWARTDEAGPEKYVEPGGKTYYGNNHETIRWLKPGTRVIPHHVWAKEAASRTKLPQFSGSTFSDVGKVDELIDEQRKTRKQLERMKLGVTIENHIDMDWERDYYNSVRR